MYFPSPELNPSQTFEIILPNRIQKSKNQNLKCRPPPLFFWGKGGGATDSPARRRGLGRNPRGLRLSFFKKSAATLIIGNLNFYSILVGKENGIIFRRIFRISFWFGKDENLLCRHKLVDFINCFPRFCFYA